jgi:hypothetical protein
LTAARFHTKNKPVKTFVIVDAGVMMVELYPARAHQVEQP